MVILAWSDLGHGWPWHWSDLGLGLPRHLLIGASQPMSTNTPVAFEGSFLVFVCSSLFICKNSSIILCCKPVYRRTNTAWFRGSKSVNGVGIFRSVKADNDALWFEKPGSFFGGSTSYFKYFQQIYFNNMGYNCNTESLRISTGIGTAVCLLSFKCEST